uniref:Uncharacterized protein n=1 Tax=Haplochromis burtoni TaxID=8153 RepID=A0A3Q3CSE7_HAPBU
MELLSVVQALPVQRLSPLSSGGSVGVCRSVKILPDIKPSVGQQRVGTADLYHTQYRTCPNHRLAQTPPTASPMQRWQQKCLFKAADTALLSFLSQVHLRFLNAARSRSRPLPRCDRGNVQFLI